MINRYLLALMAILICLTFICRSAAAKEDTTQIILKKTAISKQNVHKYTVKKGDVISAIIRRIPGITEADIPDNYRIIKELNPQITDLNKLYVGQVLVIPGRDRREAGKSEQHVMPTSTVPDVFSEIQTYTVKKGDSLIKIIHRVLKIKGSQEEVAKALSIIKSLNPQIINVNRIYTGQSIMMPGGKMQFTDANDAEQEIKQPENEQSSPLAELIEKKQMPMEARLSVIKQIITQMNGSITMTGKYYLPLPRTQMGQVTIDCSKIPVVEFDDKTTVLLDLENRINDSLKKIIKDNWADFYVANVNAMDDVITILQKAIIPTKLYTLKKRTEPVNIGSIPPVEIMVDWIITKKISKQKTINTQGLRLVPKSKSLLPQAIINYCRQNEFIVTEIDEEKGVAGQPEEIYSMPPLTVFPRTPAKDLAYAFVTHLGFDAEKNKEIKIFDMAKDGFNLSIRADLLLKSGDRQYIIYSHLMPPQFMNMLQAAGNELIFVADVDAPNINMGKILRALGIPYAEGYFAFSGLEKNHADYTIMFSGIKIKSTKDLYVVDFEFDQGLRGLLGESWSANIIRY